MTFLELKDSLKEFTVFSLNDIKKIEPDFHRRRLNNWQDKGYITKVVKGNYFFSDLTVNENALFEIANKIYSPSYVSLELALSYYHLIPESVYQITSVSTRKTYTFSTSIAEFSYRSLKPQLFFGYKLIRYGQKTFKLAEAEKALLDYLYFNKSLKTADDFEGIRIDKDSFEQQVDEDKLRKYLSQYKQKTFEKRVSEFLRYMKNA